jgi:hypothetical protein
MEESMSCVNRILVLSVLTLAATTSARAESVPICPFQPEELTKSFGMPFAAGKVDSQQTLGASQYRECKYDGGKFTVRVGTVIMGNDWAMIGRFRDPPGLKSAPLANDPDKALIVSGPADSVPIPFLRYQRKGIEVELRIGGGVYDPATREGVGRDLVAKLSRLRRIP